MINITIDGRPLSVPAGSTILDAARAAGITIPTLCHLPQHAPTSCLVCVVRVNNAPRLVPSCATKVADGMSIESDSPDVHLARRTALELLLSDHAGDCLAPCQLVCPAHMHIDRMLHLIAAENFAEAIAVVKQHIPLPAVLGRICPDLCEKNCRRSHHGGAVSICRLKRFVADHDLASPSPYQPAKAPATGKRIAIIGAGPAGLSAAYYLLIAGHDVTIFDQHDQPGGALRYAIDADHLPRSVLDQEISQITKLGLHFVGNTRLGESLSLAQLQQDFDATILALGPVDPALAQSLGLALAHKGLKINPATGETSAPRVFATGAAVTPYRLAVRAVADGHTLAQQVHAFLTHTTAADKRAGRFSVRLNVLDPQEMSAVLALASDAPRAAPAPSFTRDQAIAEARRCVSCGCASAHDCDLRRYAAAYHADPNHFRGQRRQLAPASHAGNVIFEPGKCIACGRCVALTANHGAAQTYLHRGFDMRIAPTFDATFADAIAPRAAEVIAACPTAAIRRS